MEVIHNVILLLTAYHIKYLQFDWSSRGPGQFPGITRNTRNHRNYRKFYKSDQTLNQTIRDINKLCLGKISLQKTVRMKLSVDSRFLNVFYGKKQKPGNAGNQQKIKGTPSVNGYHYWKTA